jgi:thiamine pyrophosphate-dependent acetolactate synthase large subunit-like protein
MKQSIGNFLLRRLKEVRIRHIFGVPGDYNLEFMQQLEDRGSPAWIGTCNELNGSYAADGYARIHGLGALAVTYGVGALSAINGIAGAYSEHVPVIYIGGSVPLRSLERGNRNGGSAIDQRTTRHAGYKVSQKKRKRMEEVFGWLKTVGMLRKTRHRGIHKVGWVFTFAAAAYNLVRMRNLVPIPVHSA